MARFVVTRGPGHVCSVELEGRRLRVGDHVWVPFGASQPRGATELVAAEFKPAVFLVANCFERVVRVRFGDGSVGCVGFDAGVRRREALAASHA